MMKKILSLLLGVALMLPIFGCTGSTPTSEPSDPPASVGNDLSVDWSFVTEGDNGGIDTVGLYTWEDSPSQHAFWKAIGITTLQFCDRGWWYNATDFSLKTYLRGMADDIASAKKAGFKVQVILFANIEQYKGPYPKEPTGLGVKFHPDDEEAMADRLHYLQMTVEAMKQADGFTIFAGDPGGIPNSLGTGDVYDYIKFSTQVADMIRQTAPEAEININPWAVTMFETPNKSAMTADFWLRETELTKILLQQENLIGEDIGVELAFHDYYRPLVLRSYVTSNKLPQTLFPQPSDISALLERQTQRVWAWPYFLLDEADDGDKGNSHTTLPQFETRYICDYVTRVRQAGVNGIIGSWSYTGFETKMLNTYAFARACYNKDITPEQIINEFVCTIATPETRGALAEVIKYIENDSNHQKKLPADFRQPNLSTTLTSPDQAMELLATVQENKDNKFPLPYSAEKYLKDLKERLELMK